MSFANPTALWGLLGLLIPIVIHLFNANRGRRLSFGETRFIEAAQAQQMRQVFPTEWLLLILRCALLAALVVLLAGPRFDRADGFPGDAAVLMSPLALQSAGTSALITARDIAAQHRAALRVLAPGLPRLDDLDEAPPVTGGAWSLLAELEASLPEGLPAVLLVAADERESGWRRPDLERPVQAIDVVAAAPEASAPIRLAMDSDADRETDRRHLEAALETMWGEHPGLVWSTPDDPALDLLFRLGAGSGRQAALVVQDARVPARSEVSMIFGGRRFAWAVSADPAEGVTVLEADDGRPLVTLKRDDRTATLTWHGRFHPDAAAVVADGDFPALLTHVLTQASPGLQRRPLLTLPDLDHDPVPAGWIVLLAALWLAERWLATRRPGHVPARA